MMSISPGMTAGHAGGYFSKEDYYLRGDALGENSLWIGSGSRDLGLEGSVREEDFRALCRGEDPAGNRLVSFRVSRDPETGALIERHRAGNDCTFSAPKSVSIAYAAGVTGIKEAHDRAVLSVLFHLEEHYCHYRSPGGILNGRMVAAKFDHATSRNIDPQLHSHVFVLNAVHAGDGSWKANEPKAIFQDQKSLGLLYRQALARELSVLGFEVTVRDRAEFYFELKGIGPGLTDYFSSRRADIDRQVSEWQSQGLFAGVSHARLYEMAAQGTKDPKKELSREEVTGIFERGFQACGSSTERLRRELEEGRTLAPVLEARPPAHVMELALRELTEREAVVDRARVLDQAVRISGGSHGVAELNLALDGGAPGIVKLGQDARGREFYTTDEMRKLEERNLERMVELSPGRGVASALELERYFERLAVEGVRPTAGQKAEIVNELTGNRGVILTVGDPGTGKTSTLRLIERFNEDELEPSGRGRLSIDLAHTGKAARELSLATGRPACTISSFEKANPASKFALQRQNGESPMVEVRGEKILIPEVPGREVVFRIDEAGFLGARQAERLLDVIEELKARQVRVKLHLLGDSKQMQRIQAGDLFRQLQEPGLRQELEYAHLTEIVRQRDPELKEIARGLNREDRLPGENALEALLTLQKRGELRELHDVDELRREAVEHYLEESRKPSLDPERAASGKTQQVLLVANTNAQRKELNREIREARVAAREIDRGMVFPVLAPVHQGLTVESYRPGDTVLFSGMPGDEGRTVSWGARLHTEGKVIDIDRERNLVRVGYSFEVTDGEGRKKSREVEKDFSAAEMAGRTTLLREEERSFAIGDRVVALKNDRGLDLQNGSLGVVRAVDSDGRMRLDLGDREVALDVTRYRQLDHAYAVTIHKSQGCTVERCILFAPVRPEKSPEHELDSPLGESFGRTSYNALNVALTRAQYGTKVYTNSVEGLTRSVQEVDVKTSTLSRPREPELAPAHELVSEPTRGRELSRRIDRLQRDLQPGRGVRKLPSLEHALQVLRTPGHRLSLPAKEIALQKLPQRQLELSLPKLPGLDLEK